MSKRRRITGCEGCYWFGKACQIRKTLWEAIKPQTPADFHIQIEECGSRR